MRLLQGTQELQIGGTSSTVEMACRDKAGFAVVVPSIDHCRGTAGKHLAGPSEVQTAMPAGEFPLRRIEGDCHN
jgi:hypothetical protein